MPYAGKALFINIYLIRLVQSITHALMLWLFMTVLPVSTHRKEETTP